MRTVIAQLRRGGWQTINDLIHATHLDPEEILDTLHTHQNRGGVLTIITPSKDGDDAGVMYHVSTTKTRRFAHMYYGIFDLPWNLKRSAVARLDKTRGTGSLGSSLPDWMHANVILDQQLARMGLRTVRCRPHDGFLYPCAWHATGSPQWVPETHFLDVAFTGTIILNTNEPDPITRVVNPKDMRCWVTVHTNSLKLTLDGIAPATVDAHTFRLTKHPSRSHIILETERLLREGATLTKEVEMFLPIRSFEFCLLSSQRGRPHGAPGTTDLAYPHNTMET